MHKIHLPNANFYINSLILLKPFRHDIIYSSEVLNGFHKIIEKALETSLIAKQLAIQMGKLTNDWVRDWDWIAHHILMDNFNYKRAQAIQTKFNSDELVYKFVPVDSCIACKQLYLKNNGLSLEPKIFKLSELCSNGHNFKSENILQEKVKDLKPVIGSSIYGFNKEHEVLHWDSSILEHLPKGYE